MPQVNQAFITPEVVVWARQRARTTKDRLAKRLHTKPERVTSWEKGDSKPTFQQAEKLAEALSIPLGYLFLPSPPQETIPLPDFRRASGKPADSPSADLISVLNDVIFKQEIYKNLLMKAGQTALPFVAKFSNRNTPDEVAGDIRSALAIDQELRAKSKNWEEFFAAIVKKAESIGILVMKSGVAAGNPHRPLSVSEFRGFTISDPIAPVVFINGKDSAAAQIFTLAHELAHIWIGASGISNESLKEQNAQDEPVEKFCNAVAAEVLVPAKDLSAIWNTSKSIEENAQLVAQTFRVSGLVAIRRAFDTARITWEDYIKSYQLQEQKFKSREAKKKAGGNFFSNILVRNSASLTKTVVNAALEGRVLYRDAAYMLNVSVPSIQKIADHLAKQRSRK